MIDNDQNNEEYKLDDLDLLASEPADNFQPEEDARGTSSPPSVEKIAFWEAPVIRNGLIVIGCIVLLLLCYQLISSFFTSHDAVENDITPVSVAKKQLNTMQMPIQSSVKSFPQKQTSQSEFDKKLSTLQQNQSTMSANIQIINTQVTTVTSSIADVATKITELNTTISAMSDKIDAQTREVERLVTIKAKKNHIARRDFSNINNQPDVYSLQAVIPGRAWLITNNGASLTVREGTLIQGYGIVKLIDPQQGRVITSSGRIIRFSQVDS
jgi:intracellular multiplication protein IcmG